MDDSRAKVEAVAKDSVEEMVHASPTPTHPQQLDCVAGLDDNPYKVLEDIPEEVNDPDAVDPKTSGGSLPEESCFIRTDSLKSPALSRLHSIETDLAAVGNEDWTTVNKVKAKSAKKKIKTKAISTGHSTPKDVEAAVRGSDGPPLAIPTHNEKPLPRQSQDEEGMADQGSQTAAPPQDTRTFLDKTETRKKDKKKHSRKEREARKSDEAHPTDEAATTEDQTAVENPKQTEVQTLSILQAHPTAPAEGTAPPIAGLHEAGSGSKAPPDPPDEQADSDFLKPRNYLRKKNKDTDQEMEDDLSSKASKMGRPRKVKTKPPSSLAAANTSSYLPK
uniref:Uncharacterized protein n=1 Tax=Kalanchoe fedtschenkoi TaxID=63787 RepID=A0A7N1A9M0_KALFE